MGVWLLTNEAISQSVSAHELIITILLFLVVYLFLAVAWVRLIGRFIKEGPVLAEAHAAKKAEKGAAKASDKAVAEAAADDAADSKKKEA